MRAFDPSPDQSRENDAMANEIELIGGEEKRSIVIVAYDPSWPDRFEAERAKIDGALMDTPHKVWHVGSTSVVGLSAKPVIDMQVAVPDPERENDYLPLLIEAGYVLRVREPMHRMLRTAELDVQIHVCAAGSNWERRHLLFRDWLRTSEEDRLLYERTKSSLAQNDWPTINHYAEAKSSVIDEFTSRAEEWASTTEWSVERST